MLATRNAAAAIATKNALTSVEGISLAHPNSSHFNEFVISLPSSAKSLCKYLDRRGITPGLPLEILFPNIEPNLMLVSCTDQTSANDIDLLSAGISAWIKEGHL